VQRRTGRSSRGAEVQSEFVTRGSEFKFTVAKERRGRGGHSPIILVSPSCLPMHALANTLLICGQAAVWARLLARLTVLPSAFQGWCCAQQHQTQETSTKHRTEPKLTHYTATAKPACILCRHRTLLPTPAFCCLLCVRSRQLTTTHSQGPWISTGLDYYTDTSLLFPTHGHMHYFLT
jgi:hypothetical protein